MEKFPLKGTASLNSAILHSNANAVTTYHSVDAKVCCWSQSASSCLACYRPLCLDIFLHRMHINFTSLTILHVACFLYVLFYVYLYALKFVKSIKK